MLIDKRDDALKTSVHRELRLDARVNETEIGVAVADGVVTLTGRVDSEAEKAAAQEAAHRAPGVLDVANDIRVKVPFALGRDDTDLAQAVRDSLEREADVPAEHVHTSVYDAVVTLSGVVETGHASDVAERAAHRVAGVRRVVIELSAHDGVVTLEGRVNSFSDKSVVLDLVRHAPAVRDIDDRLRIEP
jgi:osmotically-inducible protein OsmY